MAVTPTTAQTYLYSSEIDKHKGPSRWMSVAETIDMDDGAIFGQWIDIGAFSKLSLSLEGVTGLHTVHKLTFAAHNQESEDGVFYWFTSAVGEWTVDDQASNARFVRWEPDTAQGAASTAKLTIFASI